MGDDLRLRRFRQSAVEAILDGINAKLPAAGNPIPVEVSGAAVNLVGDVTIGEVTVDNTALNPVPISDAGGSLSIDDGGGSITVDGPLTDTQLRASALVIDDGGGSITVDGPLTNAQLRATAVPVSLAATPLPSGAATAALQSTANSSLSAIDGKLPALASGRIPVDGSSVTQPVSDGGGTLSIDDGDGSITVDGTVAVSGTVSTGVALRTPTTTSVVGSATSVAIIGANSNRKGLMVSNVSTSKLYLSFATPATLSNCFIEMQPGGFLLLDQQLLVGNAIYGIWSNANGTAQVTELV